MTPDDPAATVLPLLLSLVGPETAKIILAIVGWATLASALASVLLALLPPPPAGGWRATLWRVLTVLALARGYLKPAYQPGRSSITVPIDDRHNVRSAASEITGLPPEQLKP